MSNADANRKREAHLEKAMFSLWLKESGESNDAWIEHLKNCVKVAIDECLTDAQKRYLMLYLNGYTQSEIAALHGVAVSTVSRTINRGLSRLLCRIKYSTPRTLRVEQRVRKKLTALYR